MPLGGSAGRLAQMNRFAPAFAAILIACPVIADEPARIIGTAKVVDGDTIDIGVVRVRLHGIDAPEAAQTCQDAFGAEWQCGIAAAYRLAELVDGRPIECLALDRDQYGRVIGRCFVDGADQNAIMVEEGLAWAYRHFSDDYVGLEQTAQAQVLGIWQGPAQAPWDYRANRWERAVAASPNGCPIKGNINSSGERIYHTPWSPWYDRTSIDESRGQRWFCDENEAVEAGWRAANF